MNKMLTTICVGAASLAASATDIGFTCDRLVADGNDYVASAAAVDELPASPVPVFRLDCSDRTDWRFAANGKTVTKIPSLVGSRYLTSDKTEYSWKGWGYDRYPTGPTLVQDETLAHGYCIDFGAFGVESGWKGLVFDKAAGDSVVTGIGTVIAVIDSAQGGGYLLGGGGTYKYNSGNSSVNGRTFARGSKGRVSGTGNDFADPITSLQYSSLGQTALALHDGQWKAVPYETGFSGGWEVLALTPSARDLSATGLGLGTATADPGPGSTGGQRFAELIIYTNVLTVAQMKEVSAYLRRKWFGAAVAGYDGKSEAGVLRLTHQKTTANEGNRTGTPPNASVAVGGTSTLTFDRLEGGRLGGTLTKTGTGTLALRDAGRYGGTVKVDAGTLEFVRKPLPTALPAGALAHFDASDEDSLVTRTAADGTVYVSRWTCRAGGVYKASALDAAHQPVLRADQFPNGKPCLDFGAWKSGRFFDLVKDTETTNDLHGIQSVVYVIGVQEGGGSIFGSVKGSAGYGYYLDRLATGASTFKTGVWKTLGTVNQISNQASLDDGVSVIDGTMLKPSAGYVTPTWQVYAANTPAGRTYTLGGSRWTENLASGGLRLAEVAFYDRPLSTEELRDAEAYLTAKWFAQTTPGYAPATSEGGCDLGSLSVGASAAVRVDAGTVRVDALATNVAESVLAKSGAGTLELRQAVGGVLDVTAGCVRALASDGVSAEAEVASAPALRLDATATNEMEIAVDGRRRLVKVWRDVSDVRACAYNLADDSRPWISETETLNGLPLVEFGAYGATGADAGRFLNFSRPIDNIRSVYLVARFDPAGAACVLGAASSVDPDLANSYWTGVDFTRRRSSTVTNMKIVDELAPSAAYNYGTFLTNGVNATRGFVPSADYQIVEIHLSRGAYASAIGIEGGVDDGSQSVMRGGLRVGELIVYDRVLSAREKVATRNYLLKKWFAGSRVQALPPAEAPLCAFDEVRVAAGAAFETDAGARLTGDLTFRDGATLSVAGGTDANGAVVLSPLAVSGTVSFGAGLKLELPAAATPETLARGRFKIIDADALGNVSALESVVWPAGLEKGFHLSARDGSLYLAKDRGLVLIVK